MGTISNEIPGLGEARDHPAGGAIAPSGQTDAGHAGRTTFYRWYAHYRLDGEAALQDKAPLPAHVWNRIPDEVRDSLLTLALDRPELSPRELGVTFTDTEGYFVSESSVYRLREFLQRYVLRQLFPGSPAC